MHWIYAHLIGDFLLQTDWMAQNKKSNSFACTMHVLVYILPFLLTPLSYLQLSLIALQHFIQDRTEFVRWFMENTGKPQFAQAPHAPWSLIIVDAAFHILFIALVEKYIPL